MVRVFSCHHFSKQDVLSVEDEPQALYCDDGKLFVATQTAQVQVLDITSAPHTLIAQFPTLGQVISIVYSKKDGFIATIERNNDSEACGTSVRVYFCWEKAVINQAVQVNIAGHMTSIRHETSCPEDTCLLPRCQSQVKVIEIPLKDEATTFALNKSTGGLAVAIGKHLLLYSLCCKTAAGTGKIYRDMKCLLDLQFMFKIRYITLCEDFILCASHRQCQAVRLNLLKLKKPCLKKRLTTCDICQGNCRAKSEVPLNPLDSFISWVQNDDLSTNSKKYIIDDANLIEWDFANDMLPGYSRSRRFNLRSHRTSKNIHVPSIHGEGDKKLHDLTPSVVLGPKKSKGSKRMPDVTVEYEDSCACEDESGGLIEQGTTPYLYSQLALRDSDNYIKPLLIPVYQHTGDDKTTNESAEPMKTDESAESKTTNESAEPKTTDESAEPKTTDESAEPKTTDESAEPKTTDESAEPKTTYESAESKETDESAELKIAHVLPDHKETLTGMYCILSTSKEAFLYNLLADEGSYLLTVYPFTASINQIDVSGSLLYAMSSTVLEIYTCHCVADTIRSTQHMLVHPLELCMVGLEAFMNLNTMVQSASQLILLSKIPANSPEDSCWSLYVLEKPTISNLHQDLVEISVSYKQTNLLWYEHLIYEDYLLLSSHVYSRGATSTVKQLLQGAALTLGLYFARNKSSEVSQCVYYLKESHCSPMSVLQEYVSAQCKESGDEIKCAADGLVKFLDDNLLLGTQDQLQPLSQSDEEKIISFYRSWSPARLMFLMLKNKLSKSSLAKHLTAIMNTPDEYDARLSSLYTLTKLTMDCEQEAMETTLLGIEKDHLEKLLMFVPECLHDSWQILSPFGEMLRKYQPGILRCVLDSLCKQKLITTQNITALLGDCEVASLDEVDHSLTATKQ